MPCFLLNSVAYTLKDFQKTALIKQPESKKGMAGLARTRQNGCFINFSPYPPWHCTMSLTAVKILRGLLAWTHEAANFVPKFDGDILPC